MLATDFGQMLKMLPSLIAVRQVSSQPSAHHPQKESATYEQIEKADQQPTRRLTKQQKDELNAAVLRSFKQDLVGSASIIVKSLDDDAKKELLAALEGALEPPELSRTAMAADISPADTQQHQQVIMQRAVAPAAAAETEAEVQQPTFRQLMRVAATKGIPFVAFGFFDNMIMITAGEQIDLMFGAKLGLSSMAAAGLGNTIADVVGINISHTIEQKFKGMKKVAPQLTKAQMKLPQTKRATWLGCAVGMAVGCLLGLTPLLFFDQPDHHNAADEKQQPASSLQPADAVAN